MYHYPTLDHVALLQREREAQIASNRLARIAMAVARCCDPSFLVRAVRALVGARAGS
jgi:hypothetical protein